MGATGRTALPDTKAAVTALHGAMSYPAIAKRLGLERRFWPALSRVANDGPVSVEIESEIRVALGLEPLPALIPTPACADCGSVHHARCNGQPVVAVVALAPGQTVTTPRPRRYSRIDQMPVKALALAIRERHSL